MKKTITRALVAAALICGAVAPAQAKIFSIGPKVGMTINKFNLKSDNFASDNRTGFTGGLTADITVPIIGIGMDCSVMYVRRTADVLYTDGVNKDPQVQTTGFDYIDIPLNLKYKLGLPAVGHIVTPYIFTGPDFAFRCGKNTFADIKGKRFDLSWNVGLGVQLFSHLQVGAYYGFGISKVPMTSWQTTEPIDGKTNCWTVTAAWLF